MSGKKVDKRAVKAKEEFITYVNKASDTLLSDMLWIMENQLENKDYAMRCWAGSPHNVPFVEVVTVLNDEKKKRGQENGTNV